MITIKEVTKAVKQFFTFKIFTDCKEETNSILHSMNADNIEDLRAKCEIEIKREFNDLNSFSELLLKDKNYVLELIYEANNEKEIEAAKLAAYLRINTFKQIHSVYQNMVDERKKLDNEYEQLKGT